MQNPEAVSHLRTLVFGITFDHQFVSREAARGRLLFVVPPTVRKNDIFPFPGPANEITCPMEDTDAVLDAIREHERRYGITIDGVVSFDCNTHDVAARAARERDLPFPSPAAVDRCIDKYLAKSLWRKAGIACPDVRRITAADDIGAAIDAFGGSIVIKPSRGTGSEFTFKCTDPDTAIAAFEEIQAFRPEDDVIAESLAKGDEYSTDMLLYRGEATLLRVTRKSGSEALGFGMTACYEMINSEALPWDSGRLETIILSAGEALGITTAVVMADFMVSASGISLLEMSPRPGGDCLPWLIRQSLRINIFQICLELSRGRKPVLAPPALKEAMAGVRLITKESGTLDSIDVSALEADPRVTEIRLLYPRGHRIIQPPDDYDSRILGHILFRPAYGPTVQQQAGELLEKIIIKVLPVHDNRKRRSA